MKRVHCDRLGCAASTEAAEATYGNPPPGWIAIETFVSPYGDAKSHFCSAVCAEQYLRELPAVALAAAVEVEPEPEPEPEPEAVSL